MNLFDIAQLRSDTPGRGVFDVAVQARFVPIFTVLFGMSLFLIADGARRRGVTGWLPLLRRVLAIGVIGLAHMVIYPGEILTTYAVVSVAIIPLVLLMPAWANLVLGAVFTVLAYGWGGGGLLSTPGLMLLGAGAAACGVAERVERSVKPGLLMVVAGAAVTIPFLLRYLAGPGGDARFDADGERAGFTMAVAYIGVVAVLWNWRAARRVILAAFEPLGRMSMTNYVGASLIAVVLHITVGIARDSLLPALGIAIAIITAQSLLSRLWLRHFRYGPLEWVVRAATWWSLPPIRRQTGDAAPLMPIAQDRLVCGLESHTAASNNRTTLRP